MKLQLGLGAGKGLHGVGLFMIAQSAVVARTAIRHLADFKGKKIRIFASQFQSVAMARLGAIPKPMTLGAVLPALHDNALDGAVSSIAVFSSMHYDLMCRALRPKSEARLGERPVPIGLQHLHHLLVNPGLLGEG
jgi:TRAP-type C4-dicarboxylate transport system substrate-binding protein